MKKSIIFILITVVATFTYAAQNSTAQYDKQYKHANDLYKQGNYNDAAKIYEDLLHKGVSAQLYYNLGNIYYKQNEIGHSILNYERALRLDPSFGDAKYNLDVAKQKLVDDLDPSASFFVKRWAESITESLSTNQWAVISIITFIIALALLMLFFFSRDKNRRKLYFYISLTFFFVTFVTVVMSGVRKQQLLTHSDAIIMNGAVTIKSSPDKSGTDLFQLHEGTKVHIKSTLSNWAEIEIVNGDEGWVEESTIERI